MMMHQGDVHSIVIMLASYAGRYPILLYYIHRLRGSSHRVISRCRVVDE